MEFIAVIIRGFSTVFVGPVTEKCFCSNGRASGLQIDGRVQRPLCFPSLP